MSTDFFDEDLINSPQPVRRDPPDARARTGRAVESARMQNKKEEITDQVAGAVQEIERLRLRQAELEKEKSALEDLRRRQDVYERGKRDIILKLEQALVRLQAQESEAARVVEALMLTEKAFSEALGALSSIREEEWPESRFEEELSRASGLVQEADEQYRKGLMRVQATTGVKADADVKPEEPAPNPIEDLKRFSFWLKAGLALSLPLAVVLGVFLLIAVAIAGAR